MIRRNTLITVAVAAVLLLAIQLVPYGHRQTNPPVTAEPAWTDPAVRALAVRACFDCHSNETTWPWYSSLAPASWLLQYDVDRGRSILNFSEWDRLQQRRREISGVMREGEMPPAYYLLTHPAASLSAAEKAQLEQGLAALP